MRKIPFLFICLIIFQVCFSQRFDSAAVRRVGDYGKLWTVLTLFHPEMAYNRINADSLFTDHIADLLKEPSALNFKVAVQKMIGRLQDPYTSIGNNDELHDDSVQLAPSPLLRWIDDRTAIVHFDDAFIMENSNEQGNNPAFLKLMDTLKNANAIIIDLREPRTVRDEMTMYFKTEFIRQLISYLTDRPLPYPSYRSRIHYGHQSQTFYSPFYYEGWFLQNSSVITPGPNRLQKPVCVLINKHNNTINEGIAAMQNAGIAKLVADGPLGNFEPSRSYQMQLADNLKVKIRLTEVLYPNGSRLLVPDTTVPLNHPRTDEAVLRTAIHLLKSGEKTNQSTVRPLQNQFSRDKVAGYDSLTYPPPSLRLLGLVRFWSAINYFCPNKELIKKNWDHVLYEYVPRFVEARDSLQYALTAARLIKEISDGHGFFASTVHNRMIAQAPELRLKYVESKTIIDKVFNDSLKKSLTVGDELIAVNGKPIKAHRDSIGQYIAASNQAALQRDITRRVLAGPRNSFVDITYLHNGMPKTTRLPRRVSRNQYNFASSQQGKVWKKITDNIGYVDLGRLEVPQVDSMFSELNNTDAIIIDNRSYPRGTAWTLINYVTDRPVRSARGTTVIADSPEPLSVTVQESIWELPVTPKRRYKGKIIILVNETTQSQAEYTCMMLQGASKNVTIIGSQTAGADGDITTILLPGGIQTAFSGHGIHYPDGRPTQGIGIVPDIKVVPTVKGIKAGKDEVLERAIQFAKTGK